MTVPAAISRNIGAGNDVAKTFPYPGKIFSQFDVEVFLETSTSTQQQQLGTHYSLTGVGAEAGGSVVFLSAPPSGTTVRVQVSVPTTQNTSIKNQGSFNPEIHEKVFDYITRLVQKVERRLGRSLRDPDYGPEFDFILPQVSNRRNLLLGFDDGGGVKMYPAVAQPPVTFNWRGSWAAVTAYVANDVVKATEGTPYYESLYLCISSHTSGADFTSGLGNFALLIDLTQLALATAQFSIITFAMSPFLASPGGDYFVDVTAGAVTINLPASPLISNQPIRFAHLDGNIASNLLTIGRNGQKIMSLNEDMTVNTPNASFELAFSDAARGWRLVRGV
jgi:hypothetical protein